MSIFRTPKRDNYLVMKKDFLSRSDMSMRSKGILTYLLSKPDNWLVYMNNIIACCTEGREAIRTSIKELIDLGYLVRREYRDEHNRINYEYSVFESPVSKKTETSLQKADDGLPSTETHPLVNTEVVSKEEEKTEPLFSVKVPQVLDTPKFHDKWKEYGEYRKERKLAKLTAATVQKKLNEFSEWGLDLTIQAIENTILNGWQGVFKPKPQFQPQQQKFSRPEYREMPTAN